MRMSIKEQALTSPYLQFDRNQWAALRDSVPMTLTEEEIARLKGINEDLSLEEVAEIYLPLSRLLNFYISSNLRRQAVLEQFLGTNGERIPYIISIAGSVAVGKSTTARVLQALLSRWPEHRKVELITTDGFLHPNQVLKDRGLMKKKGFPQSYDMHRLVKFVSDLKSGVPNVTAPVYSHLIYDVIPDGDKTVAQPDILILEGLNVLQSGMDYPHDPHHVFVSDFVDFSIYVDAPEELLQTWYINRFLKFREGAFTNPDSYFHNYAKLSEDEAINTATSLWKEINWLNLKQNILPTRERASLIMTKSANHAVEQVRLRKSIKKGSYSSPSYYSALLSDISPPIQGLISPFCSSNNAPCASIPREMPNISLSPIISLTGRSIKLSSLFQRDRYGAKPSCSKSTNAARNSRISRAARVLRSMLMPASCKLIQP